MNAWQIKVIKERMQMADRGEFATDKEMQETFAKWNVEYSA
jgi:predicted transcriptional regulator